MGTATATGCTSGPEMTANDQKMTQKMTETEKWIWGLVVVLVVVFGLIVRCQPRAFAAR